MIDQNIFYSTVLQVCCSCFHRSQCAGWLLCVCVCVWSKTNVRSLDSALVKKVTRTLRMKNQSSIATVTTAGVFRPLQLQTRAYFIGSVIKRITLPWVFGPIPRFRQWWRRYQPSWCVCKTITSGAHILLLVTIIIVRYFYFLIFPPHVRDS